VNEGATDVGEFHFQLLHKNLIIKIDNPREAVGSIKSTDIACLLEEEQEKVHSINFHFRSSQTDDDHQSITQVDIR
jgi:hypothetical protein